MTKLVICEKPGIAQSIAAVLAQRSVRTAASAETAGL